MKTKILLAAAALMLVVTAVANAKTEKFDVDGIAVILKTNQTTPVVSAKFFLDGGLPYYGADRAGTELLLFRVATRGTKNYPKDELQALLARTGSRINADAGFDYSTISLSCLRRDLDLVWPAFAEVITSPTLDAEEVTLARDRQLNDIRQSKDDPDGYLRMLADELFYAGGPYATPPMGNEEVVSKLDPAALRAYHEADVTRSRALVVLVGNIDRPTAEKLVKSGLGMLPKGSYKRPVVAHTEGAKVPDTRLEERELPTNYVRGYYHCPPLSDPDYVPMSVALDILRMRLFEEVRTKRNMTYAVSSGISSRRDNYGLLYVTAVEPDTTLRVMLTEVHKIQNQPMDVKELKDNIKVAVTEYFMGQQANESQADELGRYELVGGGWANADKLVARMEAIAPADIARVTKKYIQNIDFVMLGDPQKWKDPLASDQPEPKGKGIN
jgi:zinc protease